MIDQYLKPNVKRGAIYYAVISIVLGIVMLIPLLNCVAAPVACIVGLLLPFATGWLVAQWGRTMTVTATPLAIQSTSPYATPAVDGGVAAGVGALASGIVVWIVSLLFSGLFAGLSSLSGSESAGGAALGVAIGGAAGIVGIIFGTVLAAIFGAIGGALYVIFNQRQAAA